MVEEILSRKMISSHEMIKRMPPKTSGAKKNMINNISMKI
jgi:hypothetical protein